jgi:DNA-binding response OmpR family regulator
MSNGRILVVEDERLTRRLLTFLLGARGFDVEAVAAGSDALAAAAQRRPDLVLLDMNLPDADGLDVCRALRGLFEHVPILIVTADDTAGARSRALQAGANEFMDKHFDAEELTARVRHLVRRPARADVPPRAGGIIGTMPTVL